MPVPRAPEGRGKQLWVVEGLAKSPRVGLFVVFDSDREHRNQRVLKSKG